MNNKLILVRGVSGAGKSTVADMIIGDNRTGMIAADDFFTYPTGVYRFNAYLLEEAHNWCQQETKRMLESGWDVVVHNTFTTEKEIEPYIHIANEVGCELFSIIVERRHDHESVHDVPAETIKKQEKRLRQNIKLA